MLLFLIARCNLYRRLQLQKGASSARSDDTKSLKSAIIDWLTPPGEALIPPISRNVKVERGFNHEVTGALLCPAGVDWSDQEWVPTSFRSCMLGTFTILFTGSRGNYEQASFQ